MKRRWTPRWWTLTTARRGKEENAHEKSIEDHRQGAVEAADRGPDRLRGHIRYLHAESGEQADIQAVNDLANAINRFEKKIYDLKTTRIISIQMAPQIRMIQNNDSELVDKIQSSLINTIPLWKNQIVIALGITNAKNALGAQKQVTELTNDMLKKNSELLKQGSIEIAEESEKAIVDIETLQKTNRDIIDTLDKVIEIHENGRVKRQEAEKELVNIEEELKAKLLEIK